MSCIAHWRGARAALALVLLAGCATTTPPVATPATGAIDGTFAVAGRLSARRGNDGLAANFTWTHEAHSDRIDFATPTGQVIARLEGDAGGVRALRPDGSDMRYPDWTSLTNAQFGLTLPVDGLSVWIRGVPRLEPSYSLERDAVGRALVLRQQAWEIVYAYPDDTPDARPSRVTLRYPDATPIEVRIVVDRWIARP